MRAEDDGKAYFRTPRKRGWVNQGGFTKRNKRELIGSKQPPKRIPPKTAKKSQGNQLKMISSRCPDCGLYTNFICCDNV